MSESNLNEAIDQTTPTADPPRKKLRGFAAMDRAQVAEIARKGGKAAHAHGTAHEFSPEEARAAGRLGGRATHAKRSLNK
jgi:general stress protein YciG